MALKKGSRDISLLTKIPAKLGSKTILSNGEYRATSEELDGYSEVNVNVEGIFTGSYDAEGLKQIGWSDEEIAYYNKYGVQWNESENDYFKLTESELAGDSSSNTRFLPKNSTVNYFEEYKKLLAIPVINRMSNSMSNMFKNCYSLTTIPQLDTTNVTDMFGMFNGCHSLPTIPQLDTTNATNMASMFSSCYSLKAIPQLDTKNVTNMASMFSFCYSLKVIPQLDTTNVTKMDGMFSLCSSLRTIPQLNTSNVERMDQMFQYCSNLEKIPTLDTAKVSNTSSMFSGCKSITDIPQLDTANVTDMNDMFEQCKSLKEIPLLNTTKVTRMDGMFSNCTSLTKVPSLNTAEVTDMGLMFSGCTSLLTIPELEAGKINQIPNVLYFTQKLVDFGGFQNLGQGYLTTQSTNYYDYRLELRYSNALTHDSLMNVINKLYDIAAAGVKPQQLVLGSTNLRKLTEDEIAIATAKGWTVS